MIGFELGNLYFYFGLMLFRYVLFIFSLVGVDSVYFKGRFIDKMRELVWLE